MTLIPVKTLGYGAACCNIEKGCTVSEVRNAWWRLSENQRNKANRIANRLIKQFKKQYDNWEQLSLFEEVI